MAPTVQPLGILSCPCPQASPPPPAHLLPLTLPIGTTSQSPFPPFRHASLIETPLSHRESQSSQALGMARPPPHPSLLSPKGIDYPHAPTSWPGEGLEATIPSRPCRRPRWLPPFHWLVLRPPWGAPPLSPSPKCIWAQKAREVEDSLGWSWADPQVSVPCPHTSRDRHQPTTLSQARGAAAAPWRTQISGHLTSSPP